MAARIIKIEMGEIAMEIAEKYFFKDYWVKNWDGHIMRCTLIGYDPLANKVILDAGYEEDEIKLPASTFHFEDYIKEDSQDD